MAEHDEGLVSFPAGWQHHALVDFPQEWLSRHIVSLTAEQIAEARADIAALRPRWLNHDRLAPYSPDGLC